jgi:hypothetical protein
MANTEFTPAYAGDAETEQAEGPSTPDEEQSETEGKVSQQQANYRMGNPMRSCGLCQNFTGSSGSDPYQCTKVAGDISPYGFSEYYARQDNPFLAGFQASFDEGSETPAEDAAATEEEPEQPGLQIGNRRY